MATESEKVVYEQAVQLAEAGQHEQALEFISQHIKRNPKDAQAFNDAGAILYCLGRIDEAIEHFEKAKSLCAESAEIYWNLAEAYLDGGYPGFAMQLFDDMDRLGILTADLINRTANVFLRQDYYGNAAEMLLRSLEMAPGQEILQPMIEVIRSKRPKVGFFVKPNGRTAEPVFDFVKQRFIAELHTAESFEQIRPIIQWCDIAWFEGFTEAVVEASWQPKGCEMIVRLDADDVYDGRCERVNWANVSTLITTGNSFVRQALVDKVGDIEKRTRVVTIERGVDAKKAAFDFKHRGKRIAYMGDAESNPMFLLQCMQKLHYLDPDYRLYLAGEFGDRSVGQYIKYMVEVLGLSNVVFFDGEVKDIRAWLRDKHYVVATGVGQGCVVGVLEGMACGLRPVIHNFPGAGEILPAEFIFNLAEDFCRQILSETYEPSGYRAIVQSRYGQKEIMKHINEVLVRVEKDIAAQRRVSREELAAASPRLSDSGAIVEEADQRQGVARSNVVSRPELVSGQIASPMERLPVETIPIEPIKPKRLDIRIDTPASAVAEDAVSIGVPWDGGSLNQTSLENQTRSVPGRIGAISDVAAEAVCASRALAQAAGQSGTGPTQPNWDLSGVGPEELNQMGYSTLDATVKDDRISRAATEFSENAVRAANRARRVKVNQVPLGT
jgi:glycosyltransferase involved in cell wall biosynthesis